MRPPFLQRGQSQFTHSMTHTHTEVTKVKSSFSPLLLLPSIKGLHIWMMMSVKLLFHRKHPQPGI